MTAAIAEGMLLLAIVAAPWPYGSAGDTTRYLLAAWTLAAVAVWLLGRARAAEGVPAATAAALVLPGIALGQTLTLRAASPQLTLEAVVLLLAGGGAALFWSERAGDRRAARRLCLTVLAACAAQAVFGAVQWSAAPNRIYGHVVTMPFGSFMVHNHFAGLMEMGVALSAGLAVGHARRGGGATPGSLAYGGLSLALAAAHLASRSRGGALALAGGLAVLAALSAWSSRRGSSRPRRMAAAMALVALAVLAFGLFAIPQSARQHLATLLRGTADLSGELRVDLAASTLRLIAARPLLGWGFGAYGDAVQAFRRGHGEVRPPHAESDLLETLAEGGLLGLLAMAWVGRTVWRNFAERVREGRDPFRKAMAVGALAAVATLLFHSFLDFNLRIPANALVFASLLGLAGSPRGETPAQGRGAPAVLSVVFLLGLAAAGWRAWGAWELSRAEGLVDVNRRVAALDRVLAAHPYEAEARRLRALGWQDLAWQPPRWVPGRLARAEADLRGALDWRPRWGLAWTDLGWVLHFQGRQPEAAEAFRRGVALEPTHLGVGAAYAEFLARSGDVPGAIAEVRRLRGVTPYFPLAQALQLGTHWTRDPALLSGLTDGSPEERRQIQESLGTH
jgi:O-antigen ligase